MEEKMMNTRNNRTKGPARYKGRETFTPALTPVATPYRHAEADLDKLKNRLLREELARAATLDMNVYLRRAANDAAALAWLTPYPLLLLPTLFEEKALAARKVAVKAALIRERTSELLALAE
jgi:hypothetical protein